MKWEGGKNIHAFSFFSCFSLCRMVPNSNSQCVRGRGTPGQVSFHHRAHLLVAAAVAAAVVTAPSFCRASHGKQTHEGFKNYFTPDALPDRTWAQTCGLRVMRLQRWPLSCTGLSIKFICFCHSSLRAWSSVLPEWGALVRSLGQPRVERVVASLWRFKAKVTEGGEKQQCCKQYLPELQLLNQWKIENCEEKTQIFTWTELLV